MKIAINSPIFLPHIGGLENVTAMLAGHFAKRGHGVRVLTITPAAPTGEPEAGYQVIREGYGRQLLDAVKWCDVFIHFNVSLKALHPLLAFRRPWVISHQGWYHSLDKPFTWQAKAKCLFARLGSNIACSQAVADYVKVPCEVIPNPYDDATYRDYPNVKRDRDLLFVGRLVSDKGASILVEATHRLVQTGLRPTVTITGSGPEELPLRRQIETLGLNELFTFTGPLRGAALAMVMNAHRFIIIPSLWLEPFGIVALEGIACGCVAVGSVGGGLKDAIGGCGLTFKNGDSRDLSERLNDVLTGKTPVEPFLKARQDHLQRHLTSVVGDAYLRVLERAISRRSSTDN